MKTQPDIFKPISDLIEAETRAVQLKTFMV